MSFFKSGRHEITESREPCPRCGAMATTNQPCPNPACGHDMAPSLGQVFLDPFLDVGRAAKKPVHRTPAASVSGAKGAGATVVATLLVSGVIWYIATFTGDFEARRDQVLTHSEASSDSAPCGTPLREGDNLSCISGGDGCKTTDDVDGRWVLVERNEDKCWVSYSDVSFQHGIFMTLVGKVFHLKTTADENARAVEAYPAVLWKEAPELRRAAQWSALARLSARIAGKNVPLTPDARAALQEGADRVRYADLLKRAGAADPGEALQLLTDAAKLTYPSDKSDMGPIRKQAEEDFFAREIAALGKDSKTELGTVVDRLVKLVDLVSPQDKSAVAGPLSSLAKRLRAAARAKPDDVIAAADKARACTALVGAAPTSRDAIAADLAASWEAAWGAKMNANLAKASALLWSKPKDAYSIICQARDAAGPTDKTALDRVAAQLDLRIADAAGGRARAYLQAIGDRKWGALRDFELPFVDPKAAVDFPATKEAWVAANGSLDPKGKKLGKPIPSVKSCGDRVEVVFEISDANSEPAKVLVAMCPNEKGQWFPCSMPVSAP